MTNAVLQNYNEYNSRRYGRPWVCLMDSRGSYDFSARVGRYSGRDGEAGDLIVFEPVKGQVYGYGRKDHRGNNTEIDYALWNGVNFVPCDRFGRTR